MRLSEGTKIRIGESSRSVLASPRLADLGLVRSCRWKGLEASLACVGGVSEVLLEILEEEETQGGKKSFDLGFLFDEVIPKFLAAQGEFEPFSIYLHCQRRVADSPLSLLARSPQTSPSSKVDPSSSPPSTPRLSRQLSQLSTSTLLFRYWKLLA